MALTHGQGRLGLLGLEIGDREQEFDNNGWAHVHHAAFNGYQKSVLRFVNTKPDRLEILTEDGQGLTPLLIACVSGQKEIVETLINLGANVNAVDRKMLGAVELSSLNENTHLLEFFIEAKTGINVFSILFQCLSGKHNNADLEMAACKSIHLLSNNSEFCDKIVENSGIKSLLEYLKSTIAIDSSKDTCLEILLNVFKTCSVHDQVLKNGGIEILIDNLKLANEPSIYLKAVKILGMLAMHAGKDIKYKIDDQSGITTIVTILKSAKENGPLVLECLATLLVLITGDKKMQTNFCTKAAGMKVLIDLMSESTDPRQNVATLQVIVATVSDNRQAQAMFAELNGFKALSIMLKSKSSDCVISAVIAVERLATKNEQNQDILLKQGIINVLIKILKKSRHVEGKAATAGALWAIAGDKFHQQRAIATLMGTGVCIEFLGSSVPSQLHFYGSEGIQTLTKGVGREIDEIANAGGIQRILHILGNATTPSYVALSILKSLRSLCIAPGYAPHIVNQKMCMNEGALRIIINYAKNARTEKEQAESYYTLGAIAYGNKENLSVITKTTDFSYIDVLTLLYSNNIHVKEISGSALALFAFNSQKQLKEIAYSGGIPYQHFVPFLMSKDKMCVAHTAFQMSVLSKIIPDEAPALSSATGIKILVDLLDSENEEVQALSSNLISGLSALKSGVPNAIISIGTITKLCKLLSSPFDIVQASAAVTLCQLSQEPAGQRQLLNHCRHDPYLFKVLQRFPHRVKFTEQFVKRWKHNKDVGLPPIR